MNELVDVRINPDTGDIRIKIKSNKYHKIDICQDVNCGEYCADTSLQTQGYILELWLEKDK